MPARVGIVPFVLSAAIVGAAASIWAPPALARQADRTPVIDGPAPPVAPHTITRDADGRATVRAIRLREPFQLDGRLDERVYAGEQPFGGLIQVAPRPGAPSTERTDVWVLYDDTHVYVTCRCWDSAPPEDWVVNELRRDTSGLRNNDHFGVSFDTFYDRRSGFMFYTNPLGARADYSVIDEGQSNTDWNPVWDVRAGRFDGGWIVEMAIPFKSLRYRSGPDQVWGLQLRRSIRRKNEWAYLTPVPAYLAGPQALNRVSAGGTLVGLDLPDASRNLDVKPYAIGGLTTDRLRTPAVANDREGRAGLDVKYGVTANLTADLTLNTDFAQVEADEQQVNLTRFSLFFPEKRDFFLDGRGVFDFARGGQSFGGITNTADDTPYLFYSRRIGLNLGRVVPLEAGGRLTGKAGAFGLGAMVIRTGDERVSATPPTTFTVLRVKRDVFRRSAIGVMFTDRSATQAGTGGNRAFGADAAFSFFQNVRTGGFVARTETPGRTGDDTSYQAQFDYLGDRYGAEFEYLKIGGDFNPEVGFLRRRDIRKSSALLRFSPRPASWPAVRKLSWDARADYFESTAGVVVSREQAGRFIVELESSDEFTLEATRAFERLDAPFEVSRGRFVPPGAYDFGSVKASYELGQQRPVSGTLSFSRGSFYDGTLSSVGFTSGRVVVSHQLSVEPNLTINRIELPATRITQALARARVDYAFSTRMFASALVQYNSTERVFSSNLRFRWEYQPGSELFVVWTDERDTTGPGSVLRNRALVVKLTRLFRF